MLVRAIRICGFSMDATALPVVSRIELHVSKHVGLHDASPIVCKRLRAGDLGCFVVHLGAYTCGCERVLVLCPVFCSFLRTDDICEWRCRGRHKAGPAVHIAKIQAFAWEVPVWRDVWQLAGAWVDMAPRSITPCRAIEWLLRAVDERTVKITRLQVLLATSAVIWWVRDLRHVALGRAGHG